MRKENWYLIFVLVLLLCVSVVQAAPVPPWNATCNCTNKSVSYQSGNNTLFSIIPVTSYSWHPSIVVNPAYPSSWSGVTFIGQWIWSNNTVSGTIDDGRFIFKRGFIFNKSCCWLNLTANITVAADDEFNLTVNNMPVASPSNWQYMGQGPGCGQIYPAAQKAYVLYTYLNPSISYLQDGYNVINITAQNHGVPCDPTPNNAGIKYNLTISYQDCCPPNYTPYLGICGSVAPPDSGIENAPAETTPGLTSAPLFPFLPFWK